jgi:hypothetical protein
MTKREHVFDCMRCEVTGCLNLYGESKIANAGKELYVYKILGQKIEEDPDLTVNVCLNGRFLNAACFLAVPIEQMRSYLSDILIQVTRDLKASMFLAFSGHYRQAMQVLSCAFENIISGSYFQSDYVELAGRRAKKEHFDRLTKRFNEWKKDGRGDIHKTIEILRRVHILSIEEEGRWKELYHMLSRFVHTPQDLIAKVEHKDLEEQMNCPAATYFSREQLIEWSDRFQELFAILLKTIDEFHPEAFKTKSGELAIERIIRPQMRARS